MNLESDAYPPLYPREFERTVRLRDGQRVFIRPVVPADATELAEAIRSADAATLRSRFLGGPPAVTPALLTHLTTVDYVRRFAMVAMEPSTGRGVAIARYEPLSEGMAEVAVAVDPAWRRAGLATVLVEMLAAAAVDRGVRVFSASAIADNRPVEALLAAAGGPTRRTIADGITEFAVDLDRQRIADAIRRLDLPHDSRGCET